MFAKTMLGFRKLLNEQGIKFCYIGYMSEDMLPGIGSTLKKKMSLSVMDRRKSKSVFSVFIEQMQNLIRYSAERETYEGATDISYGVMAVGEVGYRFFVTCGNIVHASDAVRIKAVLTKISRLDKAGLKALWKEALKNDSPDIGLGGGAGFIDIARRAKGAIEYEFVKVNAEWFFFTIKAYL